MRTVVVAVMFAVIVVGMAVGMGFGWFAEEGVHDRFRYEGYGYFDPSAAAEIVMACESGHAIVVYQEGNQVLLVYEFTDKNQGVLGLDGEQISSSMAGRIFLGCCFFALWFGVMVLVVMALSSLHGRWNKTGSGTWRQSE